jgi:hypothetical protein
MKCRCETLKPYTLKPTPCTLHPTGRRSPRKSGVCLCLLCVPVCVFACACGCVRFHTLIRVRVCDWNQHATIQHAEDQ